MDVVLLTASIGILVWMCAQFALLTRRQQLVIERAERAGGDRPATGGSPSSQLAVADQTPTVD